VYDFELDYNRIYGPGESQDPFLYDYKFGGPGAHFEVSRETLRTTGNYRTETLWVQPKVAQPASVLLEWDGVKRTDKSPIGDPKSDKIMPLRVPVISVAHFWTRPRIIDGLGALLSAMFLALFLYLAYQTATSVPQPGTPPNSPSIMPILLALGAIFAGLFGGFIKDFVRGRS
jgi:hypothetical protein